MGKEPIITCINITSLIKHTTPLTLFTKQNNKNTMKTKHAAI